MIKALAFNIPLINYMLYVACAQLKALKISFWEGFNPDMDAQHARAKAPNMQTRTRYISKPSLLWL